MTLKLQVPTATILEIERKLDKVPPMLREKIVKGAFREAAEVFTTKVKKNVRSRKAEGRDRWDRETSEYPLEDSIRTRTKNATATQVGVIVDMHGKTPKEAQYAASVEYGHDMVVFGREIKGRRVKAYNFWRPAMDSTEEPISRLILRALNRLTKQLVYGGK